MSNKIIPEKTTNLIKELGPEFEYLWQTKEGTTKTSVDRIPPGYLGHEFGKHKKRGKLFEKYSTKFEWQSPVGTPPKMAKTAFGMQVPDLEFHRGFFKAAILTAVYPSLVYSAENGTDDNKMSAEYTQSWGIQNEHSFSIGTNFNIQNEIGSTFAKTTIGVELQVSESFSHTISEQESTGITIGIDPGERIYIYQMAYDWLVIEGHVQKYPGGNWVSIITVGEVFTDKSNFTKTLTTPLS